MKRVSSLAVFLSLVLACGGAVSPLQAQFVYVTNSQDSAISPYRIGPTGVLLPPVRRLRRRFLPLRWRRIPLTSFTRGVI